MIVSLKLLNPLASSASYYWAGVVFYNNRRNRKNVYEVKKEPSLVSAFFLVKCVILKQKSYYCLSLLSCW